MKKLALSILSLLVAAAASGQTIENQTLNQKGMGLFALDFKTPAKGQDLSPETINQFRLGGYLQLNGLYKGVHTQQDEYSFGVNRAYLNLEGVFLKSKFSFLVQMDFSQSSPLLDAWMAYRPLKQLKISVGQKQTFTNGREMSLLDQSLMFGMRSLAASSFCRTGREFGIFVESRLPLGPLGIDLGAAVTSGDGRNSFGSSSIDVDLGGLKYGGNVTLYPLGFFTPGNEVLGVDLAREQCVKIGLGFSYSYNVGASQAVGEGHGVFTMYNGAGKPAYPDYQKMAADLQIKFKGFTLLGQWYNGTGAGLDGLYTQAVASAALQPRQIANYLALGNGFALQAGYLTRNGWSVDLGYSFVHPEWAETTTSVLVQQKSGSLAVAKYIKGNTMRVQALVNYWKKDKTADAANHGITAGLGVHMMF